MRYLFTNNHRLKHNDTPIDQLQDLEYRGVIVKATKPRTCAGCKCNIEPGESAFSFYQRIDLSPKGFIFWYACKDCFTIID